MLRLDDHWIWDFWLADDGERYHLFFLKAPRSLGDPDLRHWHVRIGHAVSNDLVDWEILADAFGPSSAPAFDDYTTWTGSVVRADDGTWCMFYTGTSHAERGLKQRIGLATSPDLHRWRKHNRSGVTASDPRWYEQLGDRGWPDEAWRDPWVVRDPDGDGWHMLITARACVGAADQRGVIGHARSHDLRAWEVLPPLSSPGAGFAHLEVPQVVAVEGHTLLLFSCLRPELSAARRTAGEQGGIWALLASGLLGPFAIGAARPLTDECLYSGRLVQDRSGAWVLLAFHHTDRAGRFGGHISDPIPVRPVPADSGHGESPLILGPG